jgi:hypothetical protein
MQHPNSEVTVDWKQFVSSVVASLAWPIAVVWILLKFKSEVAAILPGLKTLKLPGGVEAEFTEALPKVATAVEEDASTLPDAASGIDFEVNGTIDESDRASVRTDVIESVSDSIALKAKPTGVVMESWKDLEATLHTIARRMESRMDKPSRLITSHIVLDLHNANFLSDDESRSLRTMLNLRNHAAHSSEEISANSAQQFMRLCETLTWRFRERAAKLGLWS